MKESPEQQSYLKSTCKAHFHYDNRLVKPIGFSDMQIEIMHKQIAQNLEICSRVSRQPNTIELMIL